MENSEVEVHIASNTPWSKLPAKVKEIFGNTQRGYDKAVLAYSVKNQLRYTTSLVRHVRKDEQKYYEELIAYSKEKLMLFPYHLADRIVRGLRITPFQYYLSMLVNIMEQEKSYDSLPNFTAADCLRLLGIGRNQYIELMNQHRSSRKLFRRKPPRELLPTKPVDVSIESWFIVQNGYITEDDVSNAKPEERKIIDLLIDNGGQICGTLDYDCIHALYRRGLIYMDVPVSNDDLIVVPPLEGFVMNRVLGDYFETLLYKIFVSIDEHTTVEELSKVLDIDLQLIKNAVSLYCRLGFAYKKNLEVDQTTIHSSWKKHMDQIQSKSRSFYSSPEESLIVDELQSAISAESDSVSIDGSRHHESPSPVSNDQSHSVLTSPHNTSSSSHKRVAFLYDSTLTAFLMMGNLSPGLKNHAVTMFEVGKMADESLDCFLSELDNVSSCVEGEGEAQRYFEHAKTLQKTILFFRNNSKMGSVAVDLLRCESLLNLDETTLTRLLHKNYKLLVSMAPLSYEVKAVCCEKLPHFGPATPHINSVWFKLFLYSLTNNGPTSLLLSKGTFLSELPAHLEECDRYLVTSFGHDPGVIPAGSALFTLNEALSHSAVFVQAYGLAGESAVVVVPFPFNTKHDSSSESDPSSTNIYNKWAKHPAVIKLSRIIDLERNCGYITMINIKGSTSHTNCDIEVHKVSQSKATKLSKLNEEDSEESDFQVVDTTTNIYSEPKNGFNDEQCAKIYQEELEDQVCSSRNDDKVKPAKFDSRQQKLESLRLDLSEVGNRNENKCVMKSSGDIEGGDPDAKVQYSWFDDWVLLDCQFGLPLFDSTVNEIISHRMQMNDLWSESNLETLVESNSNLKTQLLEFISTYQETNLWSEGIPYPSKNFYCHNGRIQEFCP